MLIGVSFFFDDVVDVDILFKYVDEVMYVVKYLGCNNF